jgi:hypothetical protein
MRRLKVGYQTYSFQAHSPEELDGVSGDCDCDAGIIRYDESEEGLRHANTLLHECLHALWDQMVEGFDEEVEERIVAALANGLTMLLVDNPEIKLTVHGESVFGTSGSI